MGVAGGFAQVWPISRCVSQIGLLLVGNARKALDSDPRMVPKWDGIESWEGAGAPPIIPAGWAAQNRGLK
jgi:hypothetical protein